MVAPSEQCQANRIIVGLKATNEFDPSIEAATKLAAAIQAEIVGLLVEEEALIDLADLPFSRTLAYGQTLSKPLSRNAMLAAFKRSAEQFRHSLSAHAGRAQVKWSFSSERGELTTKVRSVVATGDYLVIGGELHGFGARLILDELQSSPAEVSGVLIAALREVVARDGPVIAIDDGDKKGEQTIALACRIAAATRVGLCVFAVAGTDDEAEAISSRARQLAAPDTKVEIHRFVPGAPQTIAAATSEFRASFIVADQQGEPFGDRKSALSLLRAAKAPVLLLR